MRPLFIAGIDTNVGKTIVSAILTEKLQADYWKPIQSGDPADSDTEKVKSLISNLKSKFHPEAYRLSRPFSPHKAADLDGIEIKLENINLPATSNRLIIEGAGGLMVPLNNNYLLTDLIQKLDAEVVLVSKNYLGSINHTLLSLEVLKTKNIQVRGIIFNGESDSYSEDFILNYSGVNLFARIPFINIPDKSTIAEIANRLPPLNL